MRGGRLALAFVLIVGLVFFGSGLRVLPGTMYVYSKPICGPLMNQFGDVVGDAGPCPSPPVLQPSSLDRWEWAPFWEVDP